MLTDAAGGLTATGGVLATVALTWLWLASRKKKGKSRPFGGILTNGPKGEVFLKLWPATGKKKGRKKR
ncbi:hypothetical protein [Pseudonocardia pini]|uniref:hypothetical protein n=1 Tax=Pseudonocardia pini TaxID=2758030 RepID=UPI0015F02C4D|nr:hypothetical protein [Pseudonocardia pini]